MNQTRRYRIYFWAILSIFFIALYGSILLFKDRVFSYDTNIAHPNIITESALFYNKNSSDKLTLQQINWMEQGAMDEDKPLRWVNHFYDPINNIGYHNQYSTAKNWAKDLDRQRNYALGDHTWQNALDNYQKENYEQAFTDLGHVLHLIADMSVPAHTRDDGHPFGDSYEDYIKYNWYEVKNNLNLNLNFGDYKIDNLEKVFDNLAYYSNGNFFSNDTIINSRYNKPNLSTLTVNGNYLVNDGIKLLYFRKSIFNRDIIYKLDDSVLNSYSQHLLPKAIGYSAGVIDLFFREVAKNKKYSVIENKTSWIGYLNHVAGSVITGAKKLWDFGGAVKDTLVDSAGSVVDSVRSESAPTLSSQTVTSPLEGGGGVSSRR